MGGFKCSRAIIEQFETNVSYETTDAETKFITWGSENSAGLSLMLHCVLLLYRSELRFSLTLELEW